MCLQSLHEDLEGAQARIWSLRNTADQILAQVQSDRATCAKEDLAILSDKLRGLLKKVNSRLILLQSRLGIQDLVSLPFCVVLDYEKSANKNQISSVCCFQFQIESFSSFHNMIGIVYYYRKFSGILNHNK